jgi:hypothetical protein
LVWAQAIAAGHLRDDVAADKAVARAQSIYGVRRSRPRFTQRS